MNSPDVALFSFCGVTLQRLHISALALLMPPVFTQNTVFFGYHLDSLIIIYSAVRYIIAESLLDRLENRRSASTDYVTVLKWMQRSHWKILMEMGLNISYGQRSPIPSP